MAPRWKRPISDLKSGTFQALAAIPFVAQTRTLSAKLVEERLGVRQISGFEASVKQA
jgi:hypothetical protein